MPGTALWVDAFVCLPGFTCLPLSPFICLPLSPSLDDPVWVDGFICLPLSFVSRCLPAWMPRLSGWTGSFVSLCLPSFVSQPGWLARLGFICLPLSPFICLPLSPSLDAWVDRFTCLPLSPFICRPLSPSLDLARLSGWTGSCVSLCPLHLSPVLSQPWMPGTALWVDGFICLPLSPLISPVVSQPGCLARLSGWTGSFVSLCLPSQPGCLARLSGWTGSFVYLCLPGCLAPLCFPSFVSRCLPAWHCFLVDRFNFLPLSPLIWLLLFPSLDVCHEADGFTCLPWFPFICLPSLWVDGFICFLLSPFICLPLSPSLDAWHGSLGGRIHLSPVVSQPGCVALTLRGFLHFPRFCPFGGVWFAFGFGPGFGHSLSCGCWGQGPPLSALHLDFDFAWARGGSSSLSIVGYTLSVRSVPRYQLRSRADDSGALRCAASATRRPPVKQT